MPTCGHPSLRKADGYCGGCVQELIRDKGRAEAALRELVAAMDIPITRLDRPAALDRAWSEARAIVEDKP